MENCKIITIISACIIFYLYHILQKKDSLISQKERDIIILLDKLKYNSSVNLSNIIKQQNKLSNTLNSINDSLSKLDENKDTLQNNTFTDITSTLNLTSSHVTDLFNLWVQSTDTLFACDQKLKQAEDTISNYELNSFHLGTYDSQDVYQVNDPQFKIDILKQKELINDQNLTHIKNNCPLIFIVKKNMMTDPVITSIIKRKIKEEFRLINKYVIRKVDIKKIIPFSDCFFLIGKALLNLKTNEIINIDSNDELYNML